MSCQGPAPAVIVGPALSRWTFIRHGQSTANAQGWLAGTIDAPLTDLGREQAHTCREQLTSLDFERAYCSDLRRAAETARLILAGTDVPLIQTPSLRERDLGRWNGVDSAALEQTGRMRRLEQWEGRPPGGESLRDVASRALDWLQRQTTEGPVLIVAHGALMRAVLGLLDQMPIEEIGTFKPRNCELYTRDVMPERFAALHAALSPW